MIKVPQLDDLTYEQILQRAVSRIPSMTDQWTDFNNHDPGITVLQTYAWLTDMLNFYMNATGDIHVEKYLKLLGIEPKEAQPARGYMIAEGNHAKAFVPAGARFFAGNIPFETVREQKCDYNGFASFINEVDGAAMDLTAFAGQDGDYAEGFALHFEKEAVVYLGFEKALADGDCLYISVKNDKRRAAFDQDFEMCELEWQYHTAEGFQALNVEDESCGFLKNGFLKVHFSEEMTGWTHPGGMGEYFYLRCILKRPQYDVLPQVGMIYVNPIEVVQQDTVCTEGEILQELVIGRTNGCAGQHFRFDYPDAYRFSLALFQEGEEADYELWTFSENLSKAGYEEKVYAYDTEKKIIRFGDGIHGAVPAQGLRIAVTGLVCSKLSGGNVMAGEINRTKETSLQNRHVFNPFPAVGGRDRENVRQMLERMEETLFTQERMASGEDYEERVLKTPGLMIEKVHVIPGVKYGRIHRQNRSSNEVVVVVKPYSADKKPVLTPYYKKTIEEYIEPYRLLNTKVSVESCEYVGIEVYGKIVLERNEEEIRERVRQCIYEEIDYRKKKEPFGAVISSGKLFTRLEALEGVRRVESLSLERVGNAAEKNNFSDILLNEDALSIVEKINLEYC